MNKRFQKCNCDAITIKRDAITIKSDAITIRRDAITMHGTSYPQAKIDCEMTNERDAITIFSG